MLNLPRSLTCHFQNPRGYFDHQALLRAPDERLVAIARSMPPSDRDDLRRRLCTLNPSRFQKVLLRAAGIDVDAQRVRFLRILQEAEARCPNYC
jgi:hypothetical protein